MPSPSHKSEQVRVLEDNLEKKEVTTQDELGSTSEPQKHGVSPSGSDPTRNRYSEDGSDNTQV